MDITVYLPDDIGNRAKEADLKFSRLLRDAVQTELDRRDELAAAIDGMTAHTIDLRTDNGPLQLRFTGEHVMSGLGMDIYRTDTGKVVMVEEEDYTAFETVEEFGDFANQEGDYAHRDQFTGHAEAVIEEAAGALGLPRVVEL